MRLYPRRSFLFCWYEPSPDLILVNDTMPRVFNVGELNRRAENRGLPNNKAPSLTTAHVYRNVIGGFVVTFLKYAKLTVA